MPDSGNASGYSTEAFASFLDVARCFSPRMQSRCAPPPLRRERKNNEARSSTSGDPAGECREPLRQANLRLHERVDPFGRPQQRGSRRAVKRQLIPAVEQGMTEPRELALDEASREKAEAAKRAEGVVVAQRYQRAEIAEAEGRQRLAILQPYRQMAYQVQRLLVRDLCGRRQRPIR